MRFAAIQRAGDAIDYTRVYLLGQPIRRFVTLALIALFLGPAGVSGPPGPVQLQRDLQRDLQEASPEFDQFVGLITLELVVGVVAVLGAIGVAYLLLSAFMEFAFVHSLVNDTVQVKRPFARHWRQALALFTFRAIVWGVVVGMSVLAGLVIFGRLDLGTTDSAFVWTGIVMAVGIVAYLASRLTTDFVVPIMLFEERGLVAAWGRLVGVMREEWPQYGAYLPIRIVLEIAIGVVFAVVVGVYLVTIAIVIGLPLGVPLVWLFGLGGLLAVAVVLVVVAIVGLAALIVPFHTYLRYYSLLVLADTDPRLDLVAAVRQRLDGDGSPSPEGL